ncbi:enoyl-CoA hydratase/isomerase family protein [Ornithinimicrobium tianjinense]|uniref:Enoyl-CoA hydratase/carnithine racemase n=1 Tax=Ornithinimicrobium tianjinense TaxID=1195761 RepID=A0A917BHJ7_9MICO|nr:enoyl-CoA hydratase/isomerase family protein [Ornithinimicrobium tianjinense]GGF45620.1 hypothetical protein GCM10011366_11680 [Ornithinimicrobium tianjinense]
MTHVRLTRSVLGDTLVLDRPARRNALTLAMWLELGDQVLAHGAGAERDPLYLLGAGGYFCAGADLDALRHARESPSDSDVFVDAVVRALLAIHLVEREVVAVVEGGAAGGGVEIMAACDRRVLLGDATLVLPFGDLGMILDGLTRWRLDRLVGPAKVERLLDGRHVLSADEADALGLADARHTDLEALAVAERARPAAAPDRAPERYAPGIEALPSALRRAAAPMRRAFPPHAG